MPRRTVVGMGDFAALQQRLADAWLANQPGSTIDHVVLLMPSHSVADSLLTHYAPRVGALEHRYLLAQLLLPTYPGCELIFVLSQEPEPEVLDYYASLRPGGEEARSRLRVVVVDGDLHRTLSARLLDRPDLIEKLRDHVGERPVYIQPWNVTELEVQAALQLDAPINGTAPELWPLGFKSAGRRIFADAGVPVPYGHEDLHGVEEVLNALHDVAAARPAARGAVVKLDDSASGDGNVVIGLRSPSGRRASEQHLRQRVEALPQWYLEDLRKGGVVEELIGGVEFRSPSVQLQITPLGDVHVVATHEQVLGGDGGQIFQGCGFPADAMYARDIAKYGLAVGEQMAARGAMGRMAVDFAVAIDEHGRPDVYALEINLRNGGTTHPIAALRNLVPGHYDVEAGQWLANDGDPRVYLATDNMVDVAWLGLSPATVIDAVAKSGLKYDSASHTGVVLHMLSCLAVDGRFGLTAFGRTPEQASALFEATRSAVQGARRR